MTNSTTYRYDLPLLLVAFVLVAAVWPTFKLFVAGVALAGVVSAFLLRRWYAGHPSTRPDLSPSRRRPEINFSSTPVGGDAGGLFFAIGSVVLVIIGVPGMAWYFVSAVVCGALFAAWLYARRAAHPPGIGKSILGLPH